MSSIYTQIFDQGQSGATTARPWVPTYVNSDWPEE
jgi:hypothetical protein